jgi:hypothetical protein
MVRLGIVDFDTSHVLQFTMRLHRQDVEEEQWVDGGKVIFGYPGSSEIVEEKVIKERAETLKRYGVELVDRPEEMIGKIDAVLIESNEGSRHLERVRPFLEAGIPAFIDKPLAGSVSEARIIAELAKKKGVTIFSSSSLRYAPELVEVKERKNEIGEVIGADSSSPATLHPKNPGLLHYGIHGVEILYALMGRGCEAVQTVFTEDGEVTTGLWKDGRIGVVRGIRKGTHSYGFVAWGEKKIHQAVIDAKYLYRNLLREIIKTFESKRAPLEIEETLEIIAFISAARKSAEEGGKRTPL